VKKLRRGENERDERGKGGKDKDPYLRRKRQSTVSNSSKIEGQEP